MKVPSFRLLVCGQRSRESKRRGTGGVEWGWGASGKVLIPQTREGWQARGEGGTLVLADRVGLHVADGESLQLLKREGEGEGEGEGAVLSHGIARWSAPNGLPSGCHAWNQTFCLMIYIPSSLPLLFFFFKWQLKHLALGSAFLKFPPASECWLMPAEQAPDMNNDWARLRSPHHPTSSLCTKHHQELFTSFCLWALYLGPYCLESILVTGALYCLWYLVSMNPLTLKLGFQFI